MTTTARRFTSVRVEARAGSDRRTIGGYAAVFNSASQNLGGFRERIEPGAFNRAASRNWPGIGGGVMARYNHDDNMLLGNTDAGTLRLAVDDTGLRYDVDVPESRQDVYELVQRGDVRASSFAFIAEDDDWAQDDTGFPLRSLRQVGLVDVAPVNTPAYLDASVGMRALDDAIESLARRFEVDVAEVRSLAQANELRKFFRRTTQDGPPAFTLADAMKSLR